MKMLYWLYFSLVYIWCLVIIVVSVLDFFKLLNAKYRGLSIVRNLFAFIPVVTNQSSDNQDPCQFFAVLRNIILIFTLISHVPPVFVEFMGKDLVAANKEWPFYDVLMHFGSINMATMASALFLMSGTASARWFFASFKTKGSISFKKLVLRYYFERIAYIAPFYYVFIFFYNYYLKNFVSDSMKDPEIEDVCEKSVVPNMLFIANYVIPSDMCINWSWTYQVMLQLNLVTPIFMIALKRSYRYGMISCLIGILFFICTNLMIYVNVVTTDENIYSSAIRMSKISFSSRAIPTSYVAQIHHRPYFYGPPYMIGLVLGYLIETGRLEQFFEHQLTKTVIKLFQYTLVIMYFAPALIKAFAVPKLLLAFECSTFPAIFTFVFTNFLLNLVKNDNHYVLEYVKIVLRHRYWRIMRPIMKVCFLINPVLIVYMTDNLRERADQMTCMAAGFEMHRILALYMWYNYAISVVLTLLFDMPFINITNALSQYLFHDKQKSKKTNLKNN